MIIYDAILDQYETDQDAIDYANGLVWGEVETYEAERYIHSNYIYTTNGVEIYYCYGADYFWFAEDTDREEL